MRRPPDWASRRFPGGAALVRLDDLGVAVLVRGVLLPRAGLRFRLAEVGPADLAADRLRELGAELGVGILTAPVGLGEHKDGPGELGGGTWPGFRIMNAFTRAPRMGSGLPITAGLGHRRVLGERALDLERTDPVVGGLDHVVRAADEPEASVHVAVRSVSGGPIPRGTPSPSPRGTRRGTRRRSGRMRRHPDRDVPLLPRRHLDAVLVDHPHCRRGTTDSRRSPP